MSEQLEALGALTTAGLAARAIDPPRPAAQHAHAARCQNCGSALQGRYCHECGQSAHVHRTLGHVLEEFVHGVLHFDSRGSRTLPMLALNPGRLTREYSHGRRARHIAPLALFLFTVFLMYFVFSWTGGPQFTDTSMMVDSSPAALAEARRELEDAEAELRAARASADANPLDTGALEAAVGAARTGVERAQAGAKRPAPLVTAEESLTDEIRKEFESGGLNIQTGVPAWDARIRKSLANPELALYKIKQAAYKLSFLLVPLSMPFVAMLFFWRRGVTLYDHSVFVLYSLSFMSLLFVGLALLGTAGVHFVLLASVATFVPPVHIYAQLKGAYRLGWFSALWRTIVLTTTTVFVVLGLFAGLIVALGLA